MNRVRLPRANLQRANLYETELQGAFMRLANLKGAELDRTYLQGANLHLANLQRAILRRANMRGTNLSEAKLQGADLSSADLRCLSAVVPTTSELEGSGASTSAEANGDASGKEGDDTEQALAASIKNLSSALVGQQQQLTASIKSMSSSLTTQLASSAANAEKPTRLDGCEFDALTRFDSTKTEGADFTHAIFMGCNISETSEDLPEHAKQAVKVALPLPAPHYSSVHKKPAGCGWLLLLGADVYRSSQEDDGEEGAESGDEVSDGGGGGDDDSDSTDADAIMPQAELVHIAMRLDFCEFMVPRKSRSTVRQVGVVLKRLGLLAAELAAAKDSAAIEEVAASDSAIEGANAVLGALDDKLKTEKALMPFARCLEKMGAEFEPVGQHVEAKLNGRAKFRAAIITKCGEDGKYDIEYDDDGTKKDGVRVGLIRIKLDQARLPISTCLKEINQYLDIREEASDGAPLKQDTDDDDVTAGGGGAGSLANPTSLAMDSELGHTAIGGVARDAGEDIQMLLRRGLAALLVQSLRQLPNAGAKKEERDIEGEMKKAADKIDVSDELGGLEKLQKLFCDEVEARMKAMGEEWATQGYKGHIRRAAGLCHCCGLPRAFSSLWDFSSAELIRHKRELERMRALVDKLFNMEYTQSNLPGVATNWNLLHTMSSRLTCRAGYMVLRNIVWTPEARFALALARTVTKGVAPFSAEVVRVIKMRLGVHLNQNYLSLTVGIERTLMVIERIQRQKAKAYNLMLSALTAFLIGLASFISRICYDVVANNPAYREYFPDVFFSRDSGTVDNDAGSGDGGSRLLTSSADSFSSSGGGSGSGGTMGADAAMVMLVQQLGLIAATLAQGQEQQAQAMARQEQAMARQEQALVQMQMKLGEVVAQQREQSGTLNEVVAQQKEQNSRLEKLEKLDEVVAQQQEQSSKLEQLGRLEAVSAKLEELKAQQRGLGCPGTAGSWCTADSGGQGDQQGAARENS
eukprot:g1588.t1